MSKLPVIFTLDLEDDRGSYLPGASFEEYTQRLLDALEAQGIRGTVFTVGRVAESSPALLKRVVALGHEIACHSWDHTPVDKQSPAQFRAATAQAKERLEQVAGTEVVGYRAPLFSLTPRTAWAIKELKGLGFRYSSSVLPARNPLYGFPGASRRPFRWPCGLPEFPVPVARLGPLAVPYLGGVYLRYLSLGVVGLLARWNGSILTQWTYVHPDDFYPASQYARKPGQPLWRYWAQRFNRGSTLKKLLAVLQPGQAQTLGKLAADPAYVEGLAIGPAP